jgi:hypothetical protein
MGPGQSARPRSPSPQGRGPAHGVAVAAAYELSGSPIQSLSGNIATHPRDTGVVLIIKYNVSGSV